MWILILTGLLFTASASQIIGYGNKTAEYGKNAYYKCAVDNSTDVDQVTWQRLFKDDSIENLATYNTRFGDKVNDPYRLKVVFTEATLTSTSIALNNVTWADESCYICLFSVYLEESKQKRTCLKVRGISEVKTEAQARGGDEDDEEDIVDVEFSCSATGKPAPTIEWDYSTGATSSELPQVNTVTNGDRTFTSSSNIVLEIPRGWTGHVDCLLNEGAVGQRRERIPFTLPDREPEGGEQLSSSGVALVVAAVIFLSLVAAAVALARRRLKGSRRNEHV